MMTAAQFKTKLAMAERRERIVYHRGGILMDERQRLVELDKVADEAWKAMKAHRCLLFQIKHGPNDYSYVAQRT